MYIFFIDHIYSKPWAMLPSGTMVRAYDRLTATVNQRRPFPELTTVCIVRLPACYVGPLRIPTGYYVKQLFTTNRHLEL